MVNIGIFYNASSFESQILNYKLDTKFEFFVLYTKLKFHYCLQMCFMAVSFMIKCCVLLLMILFMNRVFFAKTYFVKEIVIPSFTLFVNIYKNRVFFTFTSVSLLY